jgi:hypothetical protein
LSTMKPQRVSRLVHSFQLFPCAQRHCSSWASKLGTISLCAHSLCLTTLKMTVYQYFTWVLAWCTPCTGLFPPWASTTRTSMVSVPFSPWKDGKALW